MHDGSCRQCSAVHSLAEKQRGSLYALYARTMPGVLKRHVMMSVRGPREACDDVHHFRDASALTATAPVWPQPPTAVEWRSAQHELSVIIIISTSQSHF